jgi:DNA mismatch repair protein MSH2
VLADRLKEIDSAYAIKSRAIVAEACGVAASYVPVLEAAAAHVAELDAFASMAAAAVAAPGGAWVQPTLTAAGEGDVDVAAGRHPVLEQQEGVLFIANDYALRRRDSRFQIVTGPNMGGKSTYIRTLGVLSVMAQMGSFVPADAASLPVFDCICARVGAGDTAVKGVSTFMAEMSEAAAILSVATPASLVIVDELGRGTSTYDGFGLAWAISEHLAGATACMTLFATHFHELTALEKTQPGVVNRHVTADTTADKITMLYALKDGPCEASFGIHVAELAAFPAGVIAAARAKAAQLEATCGSASALLMAGGSGGGGGGSSSSGSKRARADGGGDDAVDGGGAAAEAAGKRARSDSAASPGGVSAF